MKILNFIPLLTWMVAFVVNMTFYEHLREKDGRGKKTKSEGQGAAMLFLFGVVLFLFIGIFCCF